MDIINLTQYGPTVDVMCVQTQVAWRPSTKTAACCGTIPSRPTSRRGRTWRSRTTRATTPMVGDGNAVLGPQSHLLWRYIPLCATCFRVVLFQRGLGALEPVRWAQKFSFLPRFLCQATAAALSGLLDGVTSSAPRCWARDGAMLRTWPARAARVRLPHSFFSGWRVLVL